MQPCLFITHYDKISLKNLDRGRMDVVIDNLLAWIRGLDWLLLLPLLLLTYLGLMGLALQVRSHREIQIRS